MVHLASRDFGSWILSGGDKLQLQEIADNSTIASNEVTMAAPCVGDDSCYGGFVLA